MTDQANEDETSFEMKGRTMRQKLLRVLCPGFSSSRRSVLVACGSDSSSDSSSTEAAQKRVRGADRGPVGCADRGRSDRDRAPATSTTSTRAPPTTSSTFMITGATQSPLEAYAPADIEQPTPLLATEAPTVSRRRQDDHLQDQQTTSSTRRRSNRDGDAPPTSSTRSSGRCCRASRTASSRPTWPASRESTRRSRRPRTTRPAALPTSAGSPRRTTRRW